MTKTIAIIGATGSIGAEFIKQYEKQDEISKIYSFSRSGTNFDSQKIKNLKIDIEDEKSIENGAQEISEKLDIVILASGLLHNNEIMPEKSIKELSKNKFDQIFATNVIGPALVGKYFLPKLNSQENSIFAALSARVGSISDNNIGGWYAYRASKAALNMVLRNFSIEIKRKNKKAIIVGLHPGTVDSNLSKPFQAMVKENKLFSPHFSASSLIDVLSNLKTTDSGLIFDYSGKKIEF